MRFGTSLIVMTIASGKCSIFLTSFFTVRFVMKSLTMRKFCDMATFVCFQFGFCSFCLTNDKLVL